MTNIPVNTATTPFVWIRTGDGDLKARSYILPTEIALWLLDRIAVMNKPTDPVMGYFTCNKDHADATWSTAQHILNFLHALQIPEATPEMTGKMKFL